MEAVQGRIEETVGEFNDDDLLAIEGRVDKLEDKIQERYGDRREEVKRWVDECLITTEAVRASHDKCPHGR